MSDIKSNMIYSKIEPDVLIGIVFYSEEFKHDKRIDIAPPNEFLQCSAMHMNDGKIVRPHKHLGLLRTTDITQECCVVINGLAKITWYDMDDQPLAERTLGAGDMAMTFRGGHSYTIMVDETLVYEFKTGPYLGAENDKEFIDD